MRTDEDGRGKGGRTTRGPRPPNVVKSVNQKWGRIVLAAAAAPAESIAAAM